MSDNLLDFNLVLDPRTQFVEWMMGRLCNEEKDYLKFYSQCEEWNLLLLKSNYIIGLIQSLKSAIDHASFSSSIKEEMVKMVESLTEENKKILVRCREIQNPPS